ncbi:hypothetical protein [Thermobifida cellulosilytica]|uniref:Uncharacterized protein n=1 Tax=Thermobifida cellulosilytica TB100 TaxID=665004 RepID=A0A147KG46_THECS|nr:hypothetical protein [Thermobifida cellulosilytica]KUP96189.1 hypothetical protein AC529_13455 [Thermobifida cellulosilytica TB100]
MTSRPFEPNPRLDRIGDEEIAAADPGPGAPPSAPGFGPEAEEPDRPEADRAADEEDPPGRR